MRKHLLLALLMANFLSLTAEEKDDSLSLQEVVVTGTRNATNIRHLPMTVTVVGRETLTEQYQTNVLPTVMQQVPGLFVTSRSMMGYGVSTGARTLVELRIVMATTVQFVQLWS